MPKKRFIGHVTSDNMQKTVVVKVESMKKHPMYGRYLKTHKSYKAHDEHGEYHVGDKVVIEETRPISRDKRWIVKGKAQKGKGNITAEH